MKLTLEPRHREVDFEPGTTLREILAEQGVFFPHPCGGRGQCGQCRVRFQTEPPKPNSAERECLTPDQLAQGIRLSCQCNPDDGAVIELLGAQQGQFVFELGEQAEIPVKIDPDVQKISLQISQPTLEEQSDYLSRITGQMLMNGIAFETLAPQVPADLLARVPDAMKAREGLITVTYDRNGLVEIEPGDTRERLLGIAIDIGTTTLAARLINLNTGHILSWNARLNSQSSLGADVVNRIEYCQHNHGGLKALQDRVRTDLREMVDQAIDDADIAASSVAQIALAGNPTMIHLLLGVNPATIGLAPYIPVWTRSLRLPAAQLGFELATGCEAIIAPAASAYLGGDILAGVVASGMDQDDRLSLLIDVGTNGEMVLGNRERLLGASTAAGPAFEGAAISCGTWAAPGAIDQVQIDNQVTLHTLQNKPAIGICGTGLVDVTAELLRNKAINPMGKLLAPHESDHLPPHIAERLLQVQEKSAFYLAGPRETPLCLTAQDVRQVQLAKGAIQSGVDILVREMGVTLEQIKQIYLAGSFGQKLRVPNLQRLGLLQGCDPARFRAIGNSSLAGAQLMLLSREHLQRLEQLHHAIRYVELSSHSHFTESFTESMLFPVE